MRFALLAWLALPFTSVTAQAPQKPNIILMMADDLGYGDVGFNGNTEIKTPHLDAMAAAGITFTSFHSGQAVCSPTRASCLSGRHPERYGIWKANVGCLPREEITIPALLHEQGYATGHFGKWHLGALTPKTLGKKHGSKHACFPRWFGYEEVFATRGSVALWDPFGPNGEQAATSAEAYYHNDERVLDNITGDDSRIIVDRVVPFLKSAAAARKPFFATIWFHTPHKPVVAGPEYKKMYSQLGEKLQNYYGAITAMDDQVGRLHDTLDRLGLAANTMIWFCSDNGPTGAGTTGGLRAGKRSLFEGGVRVPAFLVWPGRAKPGRVVDMTCSTLDYLPTVLELLGLQMPDERPLDGISLLTMIDGAMTQRPRPLLFRFFRSKNSLKGSPTLALIDGPYKFYSNLSESGAEDLLFNLVSDRNEAEDLAASMPEKVAAYRKTLRTFVTSCKHSHDGGDYGKQGFEPVNAWRVGDGGWAKK